MATNQGKSRRSRSQNEFSERKTIRKGKKSLPEPTHIGHFVLVVILKLCRMILFVDTSVKIGVYLIGVMMGSVFCDLFVVPKSYFSNKRNIFNTYFVKMGWGWTLLLLTPYIALTSWVYCFGRWQAVRRHLSRVIVATMQWYVCTNVFRHIEKSVGVCSDADYSEKEACIADGKGWLGFDISGHVFLLIHNMLTISEEVKTFKEWRKLGEMLDDEDLPSKRKISTEEVAEAQKFYKDFSSYIKVLFIALACLSVLWEFMLLTTVVYRFHTLPQKVAAAFIAVFCWFFSYRVIYQSGVEWLPCQPGKTNLEFMKIQ